jgi:hypothetical protein
MRRIVLALLLLGVSACGGPLAEGESLFEKGHYAEAKQTLAAMDVPGRRWRAPDRARYALYRGLTLGALGDVPRATVWLREARALEDTYPDALDKQDALRLEAGILSYAVTR